MTKFILVLSTVLLSAIAHADGSCTNYNPTSHVEYNSTISVTGKLRMNKMLENQEDALVQEFAEISMVLVSDSSLIVQGGEVNNPTACSVSEFTLYLSPENLAIAKDALAKGLTVEVTGQVGAAESSIEEYDNAVLRNVVAITVR